MSQRQLKTGYFVLEGLNSFASVYYVFYLYFFMQKAFGFGNKANLVLAASNGMIYMVGSFFAGRFAQRFGYFKSLKLGLVVMILGLCAGIRSDSSGGQIAVMAVVVIGMCFTWPPLEALTTENEPPAGVQTMVGIYNVVWAGTGALAYFSGGAMLEKLGMKSLFYVPVIVQLIQLGLTIWLDRQAGAGGQCSGAGSEDAAINGLGTSSTRMDTIELNPRPIAKARTFLAMAWLANPFAYIASNTLIAVMPGVARRLGLSTMVAGFCCSIWCFARLGAFGGLWHWSGWHYRFRWLVAAYLALIGTFGILVLAPDLAVLVLAQIVFGCALGLIYYSSLFYSMDLSQAKGEHGGIHEAAIGLGNFAGPAVGAAALHFLPQYTNGGAWAVSGLLLLGLGGLVGVWWKGKSE
jgi:predicted MFS family arabinose efflux permease